MKSRAYEVINNTITVLLAVVAALIPLFVLNITTDYYSMPKLVLLIVAELLLLGLWFLSWIFEGKINVIKTPLDLPLFFLLLTILVSTLLSTSRYASIYGVFPEVQGSAVSWVSYIILYFLTVSHLRRVGQLQMFLQLLFGSAFLMSLISILSFFKLFLPLAIAQSVNFTPAGTSFSAAAFLIAVLPLSLIFTVAKSKILPQWAALTASIFSGMALVLIGSVAVDVIILSIFAFSIFVTRKYLSSKSLLLLLTPFMISSLLAMFVYIPFPGNKIHELRNNFPQEIQLPIDISWKISATAFRDAPFFGTGPATFLYNFTNYKPVEFNQLKYWNYTFGMASNQFLQILGTWGMFGLFSLLAISVLIVNSARKVLFSVNADISEEDLILTKSLALASLVSISLLFIHASTLVSVVTMMLFAALFMASKKEIREKVSEYSMGVKISTSGQRQLDFLPVIVFIIFCALAVFVSQKTYKATLADYYHRLALGQANKDGAKTYEYLQKAENLNPYIDLYRVDMAQTNFALANALATQKGPTKDNPEGSFTDADKQTIQTLVTQAINEGRASVAISPRSARNWEVLAVIYKNITGVAKNSLTFSLDAYGRAIQLDPMNPTLRLNVATIYHVNKNYDLAVRFYSDAINLKPDYTNGYYNLAVVLKEKGDLQNAQTIAEQAQTLLQKELGSADYLNASSDVKATKSNDYKTVNDLLAQIKAEIGNTAKNQGAEEGTTQKTGALQNSDLPGINVPDLSNPPSENLPPAVEGNPDANLPQLETIAPSPTP